MIKKQENKKSEETMIYQLQQLIYDLTMEAINDEYNHNVEGDCTVQKGISWNYVDADARVGFSKQVDDSVLSDDHYYEIWNAIVDDYLNQKEV